MRGRRLGLLVAGAIPLGWALALAACSGREAQPPATPAAESAAGQPERAEAVLLPAPPAQPPPSGPPDGSPRAELVLQGGHVFWIHGVERSPAGELVALLSVDMPDGAMDVPAIPFSTVSLVDGAGAVHASWRIPTADSEVFFARPSFSADGALLSVEGRAIRSWDLRTGRSRSFDGNAWWIAPDPAGERLLVQEGRGLTLRSFRTGDTLWRVPLDQGRPYPYPWYFAWHPGGERVVVVDSQEEQEGVVLSAGDGALLGRLRDSGTVRFSPRGRALYFRNVFGRVTVLNPLTLEVVGALPEGHSLAAIDDGERALVAYPEGDAVAAVLDAGTGERLAELELPNTDGLSFAFAPGSTRLWACGWVWPDQEQALEQGLISPGQTLPENALAVTCRRWDEAFREVSTFTALLAETTVVAYSHATPTMGSPPLAVTANDRLLLAAMGDAYLFDGQGTVVARVAEGGFEEVLDHAEELRGGEGLLLAGPDAFVELGAGGGRAVRCPTRSVTEGRTYRGLASGTVLATAERVCRASGEQTRYPYILGLSQDGQAQVVSFAGAEGEQQRIALERGGRQTLLEGVNFDCAWFDCGPEARFVPGDRFFTMGRGLYDAVTGARRRELLARPELFSPGGRYLVLRERAAGGGRSLRVAEVTNGAVVFRRALPGEEGEPEEGIDVRTGWSADWGGARFSADERWLAYLEPREGGERLVVVDLRGRRLAWTAELEGEVRELRLSSSRLVVRLATAAGAEVRQWELATGAPAGASLAVGPASLLSEDGLRAASCADRLLVGFDLEAGQRRSLGECEGLPRLVGRRYVVTVDGATATITRWDDGASLRLRLYLDPDGPVSPIAEGSEGRWLADPELFPRYRLREAGPVREAALRSLAADAPGYDPALLRRFFAP